MGRKKSAWQRHVGPYLARAIKQARKSFKPASGITPAKIRSIKSLQKRREGINIMIKKLKGGSK